MRGESSGLIIGISIGVVIGVLLAIFALFCIRYHRKRSQIGNSSSRRAATIPIRANGADSCNILSDSTIGPESPVKSGRNGMSVWLEGFKRSNVVSVSGIPEYSYKDLQKATYNFTTLIGQGAFGPVYKAQMSTGEIVAVKVLATDSKQGEKEFQTEVMLLGRLHHRNLVNLVGYCAEKGQHMLVYVYMSKGSLASHLYRKVGWEEIVDSRLDGKFDVQELNEVAALAYKCVNRAPKKRPSMRDIVQVLTRILKTRHSKKHQKSLSATADEFSVDLERGETKMTFAEHEHRRDESMDSAADTFEV
ncbi:Kinase superfamily protein isoform 4 [Theobroma cacao]|uniref:Kinase superfamily protein isoform 4 n=1 Tax=Theobroma cacao TaxID=3641 RepID=A0A061FDS6_THECC|nr:Kinase superfamily protein isoform 4 [Theobroma cacao]